VIAHPPSLLRDTRGVSAVEFGFIGPILIVMLLGLLQLSYDIWMKAMVNGAVQQAGRDSGLERAHPSQAEIDAKVEQQIHRMLSSAEVTFERKNYQTFSDVNRPEVFIDANKNGVYDNKECFDDENGNNRWDADVGASGQGGARDVVVYRVTVAYDELVPLSRFVGLDPKRRFTAVTTLMNQPFATQADRTVKQICPK